MYIQEADVGYEEYILTYKQANRETDRQAGRHARSCSCTQKPIESTLVVHTIQHTKQSTPHTPHIPITYPVTWCYPYPHAYWPVPLPAVATYPASREREKSTIEKGNRGPKREKRERGKKVFLFLSPLLPVHVRLQSASRCPRPMSAMASLALAPVAVNWAWRIIVGRGGVVGSCSPEEAKEQLPDSDCWPTHTWGGDCLVLREARELELEYHQTIKPSNWPWHVPLLVMRVMRVRAMGFGQPYRDDDASYSTIVHTNGKGEREGKGYQAE